MNKRPRLTDLSECGSIKNIADFVLMIYRENYHSLNESGLEITELIINKHRLGANGTIKLLYDPGFSVFRNLKTLNRLTPNVTTNFKATNQPLPT